MLFPLPVRSKYRYKQNCVYVFIRVPCAFFYQNRGQQISWQCPFSATGGMTGGLWLCPFSATWGIMTGGLWQCPFSATGGIMTGGLLTSTIAQIPSSGGKRRCCIKHKKGSFSKRTNGQRFTVWTVKFKMFTLANSLLERTY